MATDTRTSVVVDNRKLFQTSIRMIEQVAASPKPVTEGIRPWFDYCEQVAPEHQGVWMRLRRLDFRSDAEQLTAWLLNLLRTEPPPSKVNGFWFGLFNPWLENGDVSCQMYLSGSMRFDPESTKDNDWECDTTYLPEGRYSTSDVLTHLHRNVQPLEEDDVSYLGGTFLCLGYVALVISNWCHGRMREQLLGDAPFRAVSMGHDSGDSHRIAVLRQK